MMDAGGRSLKLRTFYCLTSLNFTIFGFGSAQPTFNFMYFTTIFCVMKQTWHAFSLKNLTFALMIILFKYFPKKYVAMAIWPFIFVKNHEIKLNSVMINHEKIHFKQQIELLWIPFFLWYMTEFWIRLLQYRNWDKAYRNISFEREAYANETDMTYLKKKKLWSFWGYLKSQTNLYQK